MQPVCELGLARLQLVTGTSTDIVTTPSEERPDDRSPIAVLRIPGTGGGIVSSALSHGYSPLEGLGKFLVDPQMARVTVETVASKPGLRGLGGQVPYGLCLRYLPSGTRYITVLRDPVSRLFSQHPAQGAGDPAVRERLRLSWEHVLNAERTERLGHDGGADIRLEENADVSLEAGLARRVPLYENLMTRFLWGGDTIFGDLPPDALERAKENLTRFWFVGVGERLEDSIVLLGRKLGVGVMPYHRGHAIETRPREEEIPPRLRKRIEGHNALDLELYAFIRERFEAAASAADELERDVDELRRRSLELSAVREATRVARQTRKITAKTAKLAAKNEKRAAKLRESAN